MNFADWYTDSMDVYRVVPTEDGSITRSERTLVVEGVPCRIYRSSDPTPSMKRQAADINQTNKVACENGTDVLAGDELVITRGALLGYTTDKVRGFAGEPHPFYEPFGGVAPALMHTEIPLLQMKRL